MSYGDGSIAEVFKKNGASYAPKKWRISLSFMQDVVNEDSTKAKKRKRVVRYKQGTKAEAKAYREQLLSQYDESVAHFLDQLEHLEDLSPDDLASLSGKIRRLRSRQHERRYSR